MLAQRVKLPVISYAALAVVLCAQACAAPQQTPSLLSDDYRKCAAAAQDNPAQSQCSTQEIDRQEAKLAAALKEARVLLKRDNASAHEDNPMMAIPDSVKQFDTAQDAWQKYRAVACEVYKNAAWGRETFTVSYPLCVAQVIAERTQAVQGLIKERAVVP